MKKFTKLILSMMVGILVLNSSKVTTFAQDIQIIKLVVAEEGAEGKEKPQDNAKTLMDFEPGAMMAVVEEPNGTWYGVLYQGNTYYVKQADTTEATDVAPVEEVDKELEEEYIEGKILVEEIVRQEEEAKKTRIWAAIIIVLILAIFAVGIVSHIRNSKEEDEEDSNSEKNDTEKK